MRKSINKVILIGNLVADPILKDAGQTTYCTFTLATNRSYVSNAEKKEGTDFHRIVAWGKFAEVCAQLLKKGSGAYCEGRLQNREFEEKDGTRTNTSEVILEEMSVL